MQSLGPLVEVGCGCGYWARLLRERGVDVVAFDHKLPPEDERWTELKQGGPEVLAAPEYGARALVLCYPDDFEDSEESMVRGDIFFREPFCTENPDRLGTNAGKAETKGGFCRQRTACAPTRGTLSCTSARC